MSLADLLKNWRTNPAIARNVAAWRTLPARPAQTAPLPADLHPALAGSLRTQGIERLYAHQAEAWAHAQAGRHPVIITGTASGKTLAYNLPVLDRRLKRPQSRALYLFPTKALAHDQLTILNEQFTKPGLAATYDGDTPQARRPAIRANARIVLTNPDMLHAGILPHHTRWAEFFGHLDFVVLDEMHIYRGVFGSHVANVLRRLKRIARFYGTAPQFILTSATIGNPAELAERLIEEAVVPVTRDGAARGPKHFVIYNPPVVNPELGLRRSSVQESIRLAADLLHHGVQTIIFGRTRRTVEILLTTLRNNEQNINYQLPMNNEQLPMNNEQIKNSTNSINPTNSPNSTNSIRAYRSGYLPRQRREIEQGLRSGQVRAVAATSALELGIDIGGLGAALLAGYPGTIAGTWQQAGRAGRGADESLAVLVASAGPLDQFLAHHPGYFFERSPEAARINPDNLLILLQHLRCAAFELPFSAGENFGQVAPETLVEFLQVLQAGGELHRSGPKYFWMADKYPAEHVSLRSASPERVRLLATDNPAEPDTPWQTIGEVDAASAPWMVHPQAIYLHEGESYRVAALDLEENVARLQPVRVDYITEPKQTTSVTLIEPHGQAEVRGGVKQHGEILVTTQVTGYNIVQWASRERLGSGEVDLPPRDLPTTGYWFSLREDIVASLREAGLWRNDPNNYGPNWAAQRNAARARDGHCCQICGAPERDRQHDVHHKIPFRTFAGYRQANRLHNLVTLCPACHTRAETAVRVRSGLAGLATVLGQLAPLFLMADAHDIGLHADPQLALAEGQPGVVIFDQVPAGIGFSEQLFSLHNELVEQARQLVAGCPCADGCPGCVGPAGEDGAGGKQETLAILNQMATQHL